MTDHPIVAFISARLDDEETAAKAASTGPWTVGPESGDGGWQILNGEGAVVGPGYEGGGAYYISDAEHIARQDPARTLRRVEAGRRILTRYEHACRQADVSEGAEREAWEKIAGALERDVADLAEIDSDHADYDSGWRITS